MKKYYFSRTIVALSVLVLMLSVMFLSCIDAPLEPVAPSTDVQLNAPLIDQTHLFGDFVKDTTFHVNTDGTISYVTTYTGQKKMVDTITAQPTEDSSDNALGRYFVHGFQGASSNFNIAYLNIAEGTVPAFPESFFQVDSMYIDGSSEFDYIAIDTGSFTLTITNHLPVPIDFPLPIIMRNRGESEGIVTFIIPGTLSQGTTVQVMSSSITQKIMYSSMTIDPVRIHTFGSAVPVTFNASDGISLAYQPTSEIRVDSASSRIPYQRNETVSMKEFLLDSNITIRQAAFKDGNLIIKIDNRINLTTQVHFEVPEIINNTTQSSLTFDTTFSGIGSRIASIPIRNYRIETMNQSGIGTRLHYSIGITFISSGSEKKTVRKNDFVRAKISPDGKMLAHSVTGNFPTQYLDIYSKSKAEYHLGDIDKAQAQIRFREMKIGVKLKVHGENIPPIDYRNFVVRAVNNETHEESFMTIADGRLDPPPAEPRIDFSQSPEFNRFADFLVSRFPDLPDSFYVQGNIIVNPVFSPSNIYTIHDTSGVYPYLDIDIPSVLSVNNGYVNDTADIAGKIPTDFTRAVQYASVHILFTNGIPFTLSANIAFLKDGIEQARFDSLGPITAAAAGIDGFAAHSTVSNVRISLSEDQIDKINQSDAVELKVYFATNSGGAFVKIRNTDAIRVQTSINARYTVNKP